MRVALGASDATRGRRIGRSRRIPSGPARVAPARPTGGWHATVWILMPTIPQGMEPICF